MAEYVDKMHAVCMRCGEPAHYSQRIAGGTEQLQVGDTESYEARCRSCFEPFEPEVLLTPLPPSPIALPPDRERGEIREVAPLSRGKGVRWERGRG